MRGESVLLRSGVDIGQREAGGAVPVLDQSTGAARVIGSRGSAVGPTGWAGGRTVTGAITAGKRAIHRATWPVSYRDRTWTYASEDRDVMVMAVVGKYAM